MVQLATTDSSRLLRSLHEASDPAEAESLLVQIVDLVVEPVATRFVSGKLRISINQFNDSQLNQDALDIVSEVKVAMISALERMRCSVDAPKIDSLEGYTVSVAKNAFNEYLRKKHPARFRLRNQVRYIIQTANGLVMTLDNRLGWICGTSAAIGRSDRDGIAQITSNGFAPQVISTLEAQGKDPQRIELRGLVNLVLQESHDPVSFDDLIAVIAELRGVSEPTSVELSEVIEQSSIDPDALGEYARKTFLSAIWNELLQLPLRHRRALLLHLTDDHGDNLLIMFIVDGAASVRQIAEAIEMPPERLAELWSRIPLADIEIAEIMGLERQQVINLRHSARRSLRLRLGRNGT